jgi:hypothetical protein
MTTRDEIVEQGRSAALSVIKRAEEDQGFAAQFRKEPVTVLLDAGAPPEAVADIMREVGFDQQEVSGYLLSAGISPQINLGSPVNLGGRTGLTNPLAGTAGRLGSIPSAADCTGLSCLITEISCSETLKL